MAKKTIEKIIRNANNRERVSFDCGETSMTQQNFKQECDINYLLKKYRKTGMMEHFQQYQGNYADLSDVPTYQDALNKVIEAQNAFDTLPAEVRKIFSNDPGAFLEFVDNPDNLDEMIELGLAQKPQVSPQVATPPADEADTSAG